VNYRNLGTTDVEVSPLCLGTMMFGAWGNTDHADCIRIIHAALEAGINFIDTANRYAGGETEEIVGKALAGRRGDAVLATKVFFPMGPEPYDRGLSRGAILKQVEASLRRRRSAVSHTSRETLCGSPGSALRGRHQPAPERTAADGARRSTRSGRHPAGGTSWPRGRAPGLLSRTRILR